MSDRNVVLGIHAVRSLLEHKVTTVPLLWVDSARHDRRLSELTDFAKEKGVAVKSVTSVELNEMAGGRRHGGVIAQFDQ
ncbi:MAG: 23S rRNA (guanosine(2251)-2'-O)-methyltransferase RlmB, partial [Gammaproteobacteria bacterium]|nr:23S rRNA (guanosine(2251)-2'-O)-methyltransferase RlmB [Gammaproteobacteria bacterium]